MDVTLAFGKTGTVVSVPDHAEVLEPRFAAALPDPVAAIEEAVRNPLAGPPLADLARGKKSAAISICDITRPAPNKLVLPIVCAALEAGGIEPNERGGEAERDRAPEYPHPHRHRPPPRGHRCGARRNPRPRIARSLLGRLPSRKKPRRANSLRPHRRRNRDLHRQPLRRSRPAPHPRIHRASSHGRLLRRSQAHLHRTRRRAHHQAPA